MKITPLLVLLDKRKVLVHSGTITRPKVNGTIKGHWGSSESGEFGEGKGCKKGKKGEKGGKKFKFWI